MSGQRGAGPGPGAGGQFRSCEGWGGQAGGFAVVWGGMGQQVSEVIRVLREAAGLKVCVKEDGKQVQRAGRARDSHAHQTGRQGGKAGSILEGLLPQQGGAQPSGEALSPRNVLAA